MSDFTIDDINNLQRFAENIDEVLALWYEPDSAGGCPAVPDVLVPEPSAKSPNMGQQPLSGSGFSGFTDATQLFLSYDDARRALVGDPGEFATVPTSSALAAFVDGLKHLSAVAKAIYQNYDSANSQEKLSIDQINAQLNTPLPATSPQGS
jgi:hypothetical protein